MDHCNLQRGSYGAQIEALLRRQQELVTQLRALILPQLVHHLHSGSAELAIQLFDDVIGCNTSALSKLVRAGGGARVVDDKSLVRYNMTGTVAADGIDERSVEQVMTSSSLGQKRRRNGGKRSRSLVTSVPDYDGHQWRKYGQKNINGSQLHARRYYRCTYRERNCPATKTVQQQDRDGGSANYFTDAEGDESGKYTVVYYGDHTCKAGHGISNHVIDHFPIIVNMDLPTGEEVQLTAQKSEFETELDVPALLEVFNNSLLNWEIAS